MSLRLRLERMHLASYRQLAKQKRRRFLRANEGVAHILSQLRYTLCNARKVRQIRYEFHERLNYGEKCRLIGIVGREQRTPESLKHFGSHSSNLESLNLEL